MSDSDGVIGPPSVERVGARAATLLLPDRRLDPESRWFVLRTRSRQEKALESTLRGAGIGCYLPLRRVARRYAGRRSESLLRDRILDRPRELVAGPHECHLRHWNIRLYRCDIH